jgi:hypothetical protein
MGLSRLLQLADNFEDVPPSDFTELARACRDLAVNRLDVRFMVLGECFRMSSQFWGYGEGGVVSASFEQALRHTWADYLPGVLGADSEEEGTALALALKEELAILGTGDPTTYPF